MGKWILEVEKVHVSEIQRGEVRDTAAEKIGRTPGLEEYIEGLSFMWYLQHGGLVSLDDVQKALSDENGEPVRVIPRPTQSSPSAIG